MLKNRVEEVTSKLLNLLEVDASIEVNELELEGRSYIAVNVVAEESGAELIGHHGLRLKALSTVLGMMVPQTEGERVSILLDVNGYREQRGKYITEKAEQAIEEALSTMESVELEPMSAWERRLVHVAAADRTDIQTLSVGDGEDRRVVIQPVSVV